MVASQQWGLGCLSRNIDVLVGETEREGGNFCSGYNSKLSLSTVKSHLLLPALPLLPLTGGEKSLTGEFLLLSPCKP